MFSSYRAGLWLPDEKPMYGARLIKDHPLAQGLVLDTLMNEYGGNIAFDGSGLQNHGTMHNCAWSPRGIDFNGSTSYIDCGKKPKLKDAFDSTFTIETWFCPKETPISWTHLVDKSYISHSSPYYQVTVRWIDSLKVAAYVYRSDDYGLYLGGGSSALALNTWHHAIVTVDILSPHFKLYINGILTTEKTSATGSYTNWDTKVLIGRNLNIASEQYFFNGLINLTRIWNRCLQQSEISLLHENPYCMYEYPILEEGMLYYPTIMNQFQTVNLGADLMNGALIT